MIPYGSYHVVNMQDLQFLKTLIMKLLPSNHPPLDSGDGRGCSDLFRTELSITPDSSQTETCKNSP